MGISTRPDGKTYNDHGIKVGDILRFKVHFSWLQQMAPIGPSRRMFNEGDKVKVMAAFEANNDTYLEVAHVIYDGSTFGSFCQSPGYLAAHTEVVDNG